MATALVTGANGFVGSHLVDLLLARGWTVRALVRRTSDLRWLGRDRVELAYGEVTDPSSLPEAVDGVDTVFHLAGVVRAPSESVYRRVNAEGSGHVARAAAAAVRPPGGLVLVSSLAAGGPSLPARPRREEDEDDPQGLYGRSKREGEAALAEAAGSIPWTVLRPCAVYGPRDDDFLLLARMAQRGWVLRFTGEPQRISLVHVRDVAAAALAAAETPRAAGRTYYLGHPEPVTWEETGRTMAAELDRAVRPLRVPRGLVPAVGRAAGVWARLVGRSNDLSSDRIRDLLAPAWTCDAARAREELGLDAWTDHGRGLAETMAWYRSEGWL